MYLHRKGRLVIESIQGVRYKRLTNTERFWQYVDQTGDCWLWTGVTSRNGYGHFTIDAKRQYVHRISYEASYGPIPAGLVIDHKCHVKACVNPGHLQAVTTSANMQNRAGAQVNSKSGVRGVHRQDGKWRVQIRAGGRNHSGGLFDDLDDAAAAASRLRASLMTNSLADALPTEGAQ